MDINVRRKIVCNGKEYADPSEMPEPLRQAFEKAVAARGGLGGLALSAGAKIVLNGREIGTLDDVPAPLRKLVEGAIAAASGPAKARADASIPAPRLGTEADAAATEPGAPIVPRAMGFRGTWLAVAAGLLLLVIWLLRAASGAR